MKSLNHVEWGAIAVQDFGAVSALIQSKLSTTP